MNKIASIEYDNGMELQPRHSLLGKLLDFFFPKYVKARPDIGFVVKTDDGQIMTSKDGIEWTTRSV